MTFAVVTGGGTSGHVIPAMAVLEALVDAGHDPSELAYVGSRRGVESSMVPALGVRCAFLPVSGLQRSVSPRSLLANAVFPFRLLAATRGARRLLREWSPRVVVSVGGYASEPAARAEVPPRDGPIRPGRRGNRSVRTGMQAIDRAGSNPPLRTRQSGRPMRMARPPTPWGGG